MLGSKTRFDWNCIHWVREREIITVHVYVLEYCNIKPITTSNTSTQVLGKG